MASPIMSPRFTASERVAHWMRAHRRAAGFSQAQAADRFSETFGIAIRQDTISRYENGRHRPTDDRLECFAQIYDVDYGAFFLPVPGEDPAG